MGCGLLTGYSHKWAHERNHGIIGPDSNPNRGSWIARLQDWGLLLSADDHRKHHEVKCDADRRHFSLFNGFVQNWIEPLWMRIF